MRSRIARPRRPSASSSRPPRPRPRSRCIRLSLLPWGYRRTLVHSLASACSAWCLAPPAPWHQLRGGKRRVCRRKATGAWHQDSAPSMRRTALRLLSRSAESTTLADDRQGLNSAKKSQPALPSARSPYGLEADAVSATTTLGERVPSNLVRTEACLWWARRVPPRLLSGTNLAPTKPWAAVPDLYCH